MTTIAEDNERRLRIAFTNVLGTRVPRAEINALVVTYASWRGRDADPERYDLCLNEYLVSVESHFAEPFDDADERANAAQLKALDALAKTIEAMGFRAMT